MPLNVIVDIGPGILTLGAKFVATVAELKTLIDTRIAELQASSASEHDQVMAAITALQASIANSVDPAIVADVNAQFDAAKAGITGIYEPTP